MTILLLACTRNSVPNLPVDDSAAPETDPTAVVYDPDHVIEVEIEMSEADFEEMRNQARNIFDILAGEDCMDEPFAHPYTWFEADVTLDGDLMESVAIRKKGLIGSQESTRPGIKLDLDDIVSGQRWHEVEHLTLNNTRQDPSRLKTCMALEIYEAAGVPASRCNFAHVVVNGEDLGLYSNIEPVKRQLLRREFGDGDGHLYEGTLSDFREGWTDTFEDEWGGSDRADLAAVVAALEADDDEVLAELDEVVDVDAFLRAWATEVLIGHWDSYTANTNNFYVYADPDDGDRFHFIPWGVDAVLEGEQPFGAYSPTSVTGESMLAWRIYNTAEGQDRYFEALDGLLETTWDESHWATRLDEMEALTKPYLSDYEDKSLRRQTIQNMGDFITSRRGHIEDELASGPPTIDDSLREAICLAEQGRFDVTFDTTWGSYGTENTFAYGSGSFEVTLYGEEMPVEFMSAVIGEHETGSSILFASGRLEGGDAIAYYALAETDDLTQEGTLPVDWNRVQAYLLYDAGDLDNWQVWAYLGEGTLSLETTGSTRGDVVSGSSSVGIYGG
ncbi:MAG TPA: CotH kinase family protein [Myxococcota bacterium]|nr:CotH kinase family protein [Myxococcota bacterium]